MRAGKSADRGRRTATAGSRQRSAFKWSTKKRTSKHQACTKAYSCDHLRVRTTIDLPDPLFREVKTRAAREGMKLRELVIRFLEAGMRERGWSQAQAPVPTHTPRPIFRPPNGTVIPARTNAEIFELLDAESLPSDETPPR